MRGRPNLASKPLLSVDEAAILMGTSRSTLYRAIEKGDLPLPVFKISGRWRIPRRAVERLLAGELPAGPTGLVDEAVTETGTRVKLNGPQSPSIAGG